MLLDQTIARSVSAFPDPSNAVAVSCVVLPTVASTRFGRSTTFATGVFVTVIVAMPDFPSALAATCVEPMANPVTTPAAETLTIFGSCTVHVTEAPGPPSPLRPSPPLAVAVVR